jgi:hypothetical protein
MDESNRQSIKKQSDPHRDQQGKASRFPGGSGEQIGGMSRLGGTFFPGCFEMNSYI